MRRCGGLLFCAVLLGPVGAEAQALRGRVVGEGEGGAVMQAQVQLLRALGEEVLLTRVTGDGSFVMDLPEAGSYRLRVQALGYAPLTTEVVEVEAGEMVSVEVRLRRDPIGLEPLEVVVERRMEPPFMREVRMRARLGFGRLITREELEDRFGSTLQDVLSGVAGLRITYVPTTGRLYGPPIPLVTARLRGTAERDCYADLYLNGVLQYSVDQHDPRDPRIPEVLERVRELFGHRAQEIEAIEIYRGPAEVPAEYSGSTAQCGVVAVWLRGAFGSEFGPSAPYHGSGPVLRLSMTAGRYGVSGDHAPGPGLTFEGAAHWRIGKGVGVGLRVRRGKHELPAETAREVFRGAGYPEPGALAVSVVAVGVEPMVTVGEHRRVRPVLGARLEVAGRTMEYYQPLIKRRPLLFTSHAWGWGGVAGLEVEVGRGVALDLAVTEQRLRFGKYGSLETPTKRTASDWHARALRFGLSWTRRF